MSSDYIEEKREMIKAIPKNRKISDIPAITQVSSFLEISSKRKERVQLNLCPFFFLQPTLIIWGEHDQVFPLELAHRLKRLDDLIQLYIPLAFVIPEQILIVFWRLKLTLQAHRRQRRACSNQGSRPCLHGREAQGIPQALEILSH